MTVFALMGAEALWLHVPVAAVARSSPPTCPSARATARSRASRSGLLPVGRSARSSGWSGRPKPESKWKKIGPWGRGKDMDERLAAVEAATHHEQVAVTAGVGAVEDHRPLARRHREARAARVIAARRRGAHRCPAKVSSRCAGSERAPASAPRTPRRRPRPPARTGAAARGRHGAAARGAERGRRPGGRGREGGPPSCVRTMGATAARVSVPCRRRRAARAPGSSRVSAPSPGRPLILQNA